MVHVIAKLAHALLVVDHMFLSYFFNCLTILEIGWLPNCSYVNLDDHSFHVWIICFLYAGFCGETEEEHEDTLSLMKAVGYDMAYMFAYSMREKTHAHRNYVDDVPEDAKQRRLTELIEAFRESTGQCFDSQLGSVQLVLVEGPNKRASDTELIGKSDRGHRVSFRNLPVPDRVENDGKRNPRVGDFVEVRISKSSRASLFGEALAITKLSSFYDVLHENAVACASRNWSIFLRCLW